MSPWPEGIQDLCLAWPANQRTLLRVACTPAAGRTLADWATFTLTIRQDPAWPRAGSGLFVPLDPSQGAEPVVQVNGTPDAAPGVTVLFDFTVPADPGFRRYALDVRGTGGTAGEVAFLPATWLSVFPSVK